MGGLLYDQQVATLLRKDRSPMHDNPYEPPRHNHEAALVNVGLDGVLKRKLPRAFWVTWISVTGLSLLAAIFIALLGLINSRSGSGVRSEPTVVLIMISIWPLVLSAFILFRAKQCERYQHRCLASHGVVIYLACFGVCFGLAYLSVAIYMMLLMFAANWSPIAPSPAAPAPRMIGIIEHAAMLVPVLVMYVFFLHLSARRPTLHDQNKTALDATH
jgi:hypothetical protein